MDPTCPLCGASINGLRKHPRIRVYVVVLDGEYRAMLNELFERHGCEVRTFSSYESFLEVAQILVLGCVVLRLDVTDLKSIDHIADIKAANKDLPLIAIGRSTDVHEVVLAMKAGASDFLQEPLEEVALVQAAALSLYPSQDSSFDGEKSTNARWDIETLSARERQVLEGMLEGAGNKMIAKALGLSPRTVEGYRKRVMERLGARNLTEALRLALAAGL